MGSGGHDSPAGPVFVGGTGRCGTHAVAALLASGGEYALVPGELRLHTDLAGLPAFARGERGRLPIARDLLTRWWSRPAPWGPGDARGTRRFVSRRRNLGAVARLLTAGPRADRHRLSGDYVRALLDPLAPRPGAWVEKTPDNCAAAGFLASLFPRMRVVHVIRDGRDVACSFMRVPWAPDAFEPALRLWERSLLSAHLGTQEIEPSRVHCLLIEDLVARERERSYGEMLAFLGLTDGAARRSFFERELTPAHARIGRWRLDLAPSEHAHATTLYAGSLERLRGAGVLPLPPLDSEPPPVRRPGARSSVDPWAPTTA